MSPADQHDDGRRQGSYTLIFLNSIPGKALSPEVVKHHAAHLAELDNSGKLVLAGPIPERAVSSCFAPRAWPKRKRSPRKTRWCGAHIRPTSSAPSS